MHPWWPHPFLALSLRHEHHPPILPHPLLFGTALWPTLSATNSSKPWTSTTSPASQSGWLTHPFPPCPWRCGAWWLAWPLKPWILADACCGSATTMCDRVVMWGRYATWRRPGSGSTFTTSRTLTMTNRHVFSRPWLLITLSCLFGMGNCLSACRAQLRVDSRFCFGGSFVFVCV